jgi:predicted kinase
MTLTVITGPPCAGKTTLVSERRAVADLVIDLDAIARAFGYPADHVEWNDPHPAVAAARTARQAVLDQVTSGRSRCNVWLIDSKPHPTSLRIYRRVGATVIDLDPGRELCHRRADDDGRSAGTHDQIDRWYGIADRGSRSLDVFG